MNNNEKNILSLDMEYNQPSRSIIQIGVAIGDINTGRVLTTRGWYIQAGEELAPFIIKLTGITQEDVDISGVSLIGAYTQIKAMHEQYHCYRNPLTWGGGDSIDLRYALNMDENQFLFGRRWIDVKTLFIARNMVKQLPLQSGLAKSMTKVGLTFKGRKHNAIDDAYNTFIMYHKLINEFK